MMEAVRAMMRSVVPTGAYTWAYRRFHAGLSIARNGYGAYRILRDASAGRVTANYRVVQVAIRGIPHPLHLRCGTTDASEIHHTFILRSYDHPPPGDPRLIVDAGANIGDTAVWYLNRFPRARVIAVEPDPDNFEILARNCAPYGGRVELIRAGLWYQDGELVLNDWPDKNAISVTGDARASGSRVQAVSLRKLTGDSKIDIFKCDIEGAELPLFEHEPGEWLDRVGMMLIDIHGEAARKAVVAAARAAGFEFKQHRELYIFRRR